MIYCANCGAQLQDTAVFCHKCGTKVQRVNINPQTFLVEPQPMAQPQPVPMPMVEPQPMAQPQPVPMPMVEPQPMVQPQPQPIFMNFQPIMPPPVVPNGIVIDRITEVISDGCRMLLDYENENLTIRYTRTIVYQDSMDLRISYSDITGIEWNSDRRGGTAVFVAGGMKYVRKDNSALLAMRANNAEEQQLYTAICQLGAYLKVEVRPSGGYYVPIDFDSGKFDLEPTVYYRHCNGCGKYYTYSDKDLTRSAILKHKSATELIIEPIINYDRCIRCNSEDVHEISEDDYKLHAQEQPGAQSNTAAAGSVSGAADELIKLKELLDMGVISQEDYDAKKKQLLGI